MERAIAVADTPPEHPFDLLTVDLMFTVLELEGNTTPRAFKAALYRNFGYVPEEAKDSPLELSDDDIHARIDRLRHRFAPIRSDAEFWRIVNLYWFEGVLKESDPRRAQHALVYATRVRDVLLRHREMYTVRPSMIQLLRDMRETGVRVVILSNQIDDVAREHIDRFGIADAFDAVYTSEQVGVMKPHAEAWGRVLAIESDISGRDISPANAIHIGNSPNSDTGAAALGMRVALYDRYNDLSGLAEGDLSNISIPQQNPVDLLRWVGMGLVTVHSTVESLREHLSSRLALRAAG